MKETTKNRFKEHTKIRFEERFKKSLSDELYKELCNKCKDKNIEYTILSGNTAKKIIDFKIDNFKHIICVYHRKTGLVKTIIPFTKKMENKRNKKNLEHIIEKHSKINKLYEEDKYIDEELTENFVVFPISNDNEKENKET